MGRREVWGRTGEEEYQERGDDKRREEKRCGEEGDGLMDFDGWDVLMYEPHPSPP